LETYPTTWRRRYASWSCAPVLLLTRVVSCLLAFMVRNDFLGRGFSLARMHLGAVQTLHALLCRWGFEVQLSEGLLTNFYPCPERALSQCYPRGLECSTYFSGPGNLLIAVPSTVLYIFAIRGEGFMVLYHL